MGWTTCLRSNHVVRAINAYDRCDGAQPGAAEAGMKEEFMRRLAYLAALALVAALALAPDAGAQTNTMTVSIEDFFFSPAHMTVQPGTTVTWVNNGQAPHTVTATDPAGTFDSGTLQPGESFSFTFKQPGAYGYYCTIHPFMKGTVTVGGGGETGASAMASDSSMTSASSSPTAGATASPAAMRTLPSTGGGSWLALTAATALMVLGAVVLGLRRHGAL